MNSAAPIASDLEALRVDMVGKRIAFIQVCGINTLKTLDPPLSTLVGDVVKDLTAEVQERTLRLFLRAHVLVFDLARTGTAITLPSTETWSPSDGTPMPTVRIGFADRTGLDLKEPAKTKRIALTIRVA